MSNRACGSTWREPRGDWWEKSLLKFLQLAALPRRPALRARSPPCCAFGRAKRPLGKRTVKHLPELASDWTPKRRKTRSHHKRCCTSQLTVCPFSHSMFIWNHQTPRRRLNLLSIQICWTQAPNIVTRDVVFVTIKNVFGNILYLLSANMLQC